MPPPKNTQDSVCTKFASQLEQSIAELKANRKNDQIDLLETRVVSARFGLKQCQEKQLDDKWAKQREVAFGKSLQQTQWG